MSVDQRPGSWPDKDPEFAQLWHANQKHLVALYGARHILSEAGGHLLTEEDPALIAHAVDWVVRRARETQPDDRREKVNPS